MKCTLLIEQLGLEGYGIFWVLIETLRDQTDHRYPFILLGSLARKYNTTAEKMNVVIRNYGLFQVENDDFFFSESLNRRMELVNEKSNKARISASHRWNNRSLPDGNANAMRTHSDGNAIKEKKRKEKKENNSVFEQYKSMFSESVYDSLLDFEENRSVMKNTITAASAKRLVNKLLALSQVESEQLEIIGNSIMNNWKGFFELKVKPKQEGNQYKWKN